MPWSISLLKKPPSLKSTCRKNLAPFLMITKQSWNRQLLMHSDNKKLQLQTTKGESGFGFFSFLFSPLALPSCSVARSRDLTIFSWYSRSPFAPCFYSLGSRRQRDHMTNDHAPFAELPRSFYAPVLRICCEILFLFLFSPPVLSAI